MSNNKKVFSLFKKVMLDLDISESKMARDLGMSVEELKLYINGWKRPSSEMKKKLAAYLYVQPNDLFYD